MGLQAEPLRLKGYRPAATEGITDNWRTFDTRREDFLLGSSQNRGITAILPFHHFFDELKEPPAFSLLVRFGWESVWTR